MAKGDKKKDKKDDVVSTNEYLFNLGYVLDLVKSDPSLQEFVGRVTRYMDKNKGRTPTAYELSGFKEGIAWFDKYNSDQELARMQQLDPRTRDDFNNSLETKRETVKNLAIQYGVTLSNETINSIALDARLDQLSQFEIEARITPYLENAISIGSDLSGRAAEAERELVQWSRKNGLTITGNSVAKYVSAVARGESTVEDAKNDLRGVYLRNEYPAWSDRIAQGDDPSDIASPYKAKMAALLELDEDMIDLNDSLLQRGLQGVGADGKPKVTPLYQFESEVRNDPRWQYTNNARASYSKMADDVLKMFGFR